MKQLVDSHTHATDTDGFYPDATKVRGTGRSIVAICEDFRSPHTGVREAAGLEHSSSHREGKTHASHPHTWKGNIALRAQRLGELPWRALGSVLYHRG